MSFDVKRMVKFEHNVGSTDQKIRYAVGIAALLIAVFKGNIFLLLLGIILVGSAYLTWCPILSGLGKNTCGTDTGAAAASEGESAEDATASTSEVPAPAPEEAPPASEESASTGEEAAAASEEESSSEQTAPSDEEKS